MNRFCVKNFSSWAAVCGCFSMNDIKSSKSIEPPTIVHSMKAEIIATIEHLIDESKP